MNNDRYLVEFHFVKVARHGATLIVVPFKSVEDFASQLNKQRAIADFLDFRSVSGKLYGFNRSALAYWITYDPDDD